MEYQFDPAQMTALAAICDRFKVRRLELFGSGANGRFDPQKSDLDFLVAFDRPPGVDVFDQYFGLSEALAGLFQKNIDLVVEKAIKNPYFRQGVDQSRRLVYAA